MGNRGLRALAIAALLIAAAAAIGTGAYNAGVAQGLAEAERATAVPGAPHVYVWPRPWGFGFGFFPLLFLFFLFFGLRGLFWRGPWYGWGSRHDGVPPAFDDWHRRAHAHESRERTETQSS